MSRITTQTVADPDKVFAQRYLPEIEARTLRHYNRLDREAREEALQETRCLSWMMFRSAAGNGKVGSKSVRNGDGGRPDFTPCTLAWYANRSFDSGRRFAGSSTTDVMADGTRVAGRVHIRSIDELDGDALLESFRDRRAEGDPARLAGERIDWADFRRSGLLNEKGLRTLDLLALGFRNGELSRAIGVCPARVSQLVHQHIADGVREFFGEGIVPTSGKRVERRQHRKGRHGKQKRQKRPQRARRQSRRAG